MKTDTEQFPFIVTGIVIRPEGTHEYFISSMGEEILVREYEIQEVKDYTLN